MNFTRNIALCAPIEFFGIFIGLAIYYYMSVA